MATNFEVLLPFGDPSAQFAAEAALDVIDDLEEQLSVYKPASEVSYLNSTAFAGPVAVEQGLFDLLHQAAHLSHETHGAFDIATGALTKAWGFYQRQGRVPTPTERSKAMAAVGSRFLAFDVDHRTVRYLREGLEINLGAIGKGYALDRAVDILTRERGIRCGLMHGGSSSVRAIGSLNPDGRGWPILLKHPWLEGVHLGTLFLADASMGTSSATFQHFEYNGQKLGHVLDPRSGWPTTGVQQVSVIARTAAETDALSTAFFVLGPDATERWCRSRPDIGVVMLADGETTVRTWNLPKNLFQPSLPA
ncbi:FAD:protein FMN transferase [Zavarzinella formosa]|uniref:FAD:protein FMN transferase n=1 Tax=Zavarzinella formosa TaxID=360055 RepID=UPI0012F9BB78|nr:FAD:protein FMN transferase [Zavarzinella formosa]